MISSDFIHTQCVIYTGAFLVGVAVYGLFLIMLLNSFLLGACIQTLNGVTTYTFNVTNKSHVGHDPFDPEI